MIIRSFTRRSGVFPSLAQKSHHVPALLNHPELEANGIPGLFSKEGFRIAYTQYQKHVIEQLNTMTSGSKYENMDPKSVVVDIARDPTTAYMFNVASMAFNNHFFFRGINTNPNVQSTPSAALQPLINRNFSSLDSLRETFLLTADAMFGPGFVWLVQTDDASAAAGSLRILSTYIAGSPLSGAHYRRQAVDMNTENTDSYAGAFGASSRARDNKAKKPLGGVDVTPLLCVNTWEHVWLHDYGIGGKMKYLERWWDKIDWAQAEQFVSKPAPRSMSQGIHKFAGI
ncbi:Fe superoxide dismutase-like protein [Bimuria novae-zelandiae CBS 107.79]|uniref:Fe superoxide dismutase-like protein n=1 Tax=Bimuria novae-zelandiae CBS 107.79 TaxID=1447943 RepID=A0A6A5V300_9PLEO|nr:Fe superoxide dismutase-like protein [Bimuria novae-zelandiae CBS 107.79]